jgi:acetyl-CoA carboxylase biotin carboxyl carrier protein
MDEEQLHALRRLLALVDRYQLAEVVVEEEGVTITIRGPDARRAPEWDLGFGETILSEADAPLPVEAGEHGRPVPAEPIPALEVEVEAEEFHRLLSPMTGLFYRSASPETPPYVHEGDEVEEGQTVGLIEAMKVFSDIPADVGGIVVRILVESGALVSQGDPIMLLAPYEPDV